MERRVSAAFRAAVLRLRVRPARSPAPCWSFFQLGSLIAQISRIDDGLWSGGDPAPNPAYISSISASVISPRSYARWHRRQRGRYFSGLVRQFGMWATSTREGTSKPQHAHLRWSTGNVTAGRRSFLEGIRVGRGGDDRCGDFS